MASLSRIQKMSFKSFYQLEIKVEEPKVIFSSLGMTQKISCSRKYQTQAIIAFLKISLFQHVLAKWSRSSSSRI